MGDLGWRCPEGGCRINWVREQKGSHVEWQRILFFLISSYSLYLFSFIFNWKRVALEWCVGSTNRISHQYTHLPSLLSLPPAPPPPHSSGSAQSAELSSQRITEAPTSSASPGVVYRCRRGSRSSSPGSFPSVSTSPFSVSLLLLADRFISTVFLVSIYMH